MFLRFNGKKKIANADVFRATFNREIGKEIKSDKEISFFEIYDQFIEDEGKKNQ